MATIATQSANFNRPADTTAYAANDAVANNVTAGSVTVLSWTTAEGSGVIRAVRVRKSNEAVATPTIRVWFYESAPTPGAGDNAAFVHPLAASIGYVDVPVVNAGSDDAGGWVSVDLPFVSAAVKGLLQTLSAFTPASAETFTVDIWYLT